MEVATSTPTASPAPAPSAPSTSPSSSASTSTATPAASTTSSARESGSKATSPRELAREYANKAAKELGLLDEPPATEGDTSDGTATLEEATAPTQEQGKTVEAKAEKADEPSPSDPQSIKISEALKAIPDKKVQNEIRGLAYTGKEFRDLKMTPAEGKELRSMFPSVEVAKQAHESARVAYEVIQAFGSGTPEGFDYVLQNFQQVNPAAFGRLIEHVADRLPQASKQSAEQLYRRGAAASISNMRRAAEVALQRGDEARAHEYATAAQIYEEFIFPNGLQERPRQNPNDPVAREVAQLRAEKARFQSEQRAGLMQNVSTSYNNVVSKEALDIIKSAADGTAYTQKALDRMTNDVVNRVREKVQNNEHVKVAVVNHLNQGNGKAATDYLVQTARQYLAAEAAEVLRDYAETFGSVQAERAQKQEQAISKKDVGGAPATSAPADNKPLDTRGMNGRELLRAALKKRGLTL